MSSSTEARQSRYYLPAESSQHAGTIMTWPTVHSIFTPSWSYSGANVTETRLELADLITSIAQYEPVQVFVRDPASYPNNVNDACGYESAHRLLNGHPNITLHISPNVDSLWSRDNGALFAYTTDGRKMDNTWYSHDDPGVGFDRKDTSSSVVGLVLSFDQWGRKLPPSPESYMAADETQTMGLSSVLAPFVGEGGAIEVDGEGTLIATESSLLNPNRNPGVTMAQMEEHFFEMFGVVKTIWIPGWRGYDITDDHVDGLVRFGGLTADGKRTVFVDRPYVAPNATRKERENALSDYNPCMRILGESTDAKGREFNIVVLQEPNPKAVLGKDYDPDSGPSVAYVNFHVVNGAVMLSKFGDAQADNEAARLVAENMPGRNVVQVYTHQLAIQGGGIHCSTQQYYL